jgi:hypothetical protein
MPRTQYFDIAELPTLKQEGRFQLSVVLDRNRPCLYPSADLNLPVSSSTVVSRLDLRRVLQGGETSFERLVCGFQLRDLRLKLFEFVLLLLKLSSPFVHRFDRGEIHAGEILNADRFVARAEVERAEKVLRHRSHVARLVAFRDVVPGADRDFAQPRQYVITIKPS